MLGHGQVAEAIVLTSPSLHRQMMGGKPVAGEEGVAGSVPPEMQDDGILLACRTNDHATALFAHPSHTPAVDVYGDGRLIAGYSYLTLQNCAGDLSVILQRHLSSK